MKNTFFKFSISLVVLLSFIILQACNQPETNQEQTETGQEEPTETEMHEHHHEHDDAHAHGHEGDTTDMLSLNNGSKWSADEPTNRNAAVLISIGEEFSGKSNITLEDYQTFGKDINAAINTMIKECTMKGEADQALHYWFMPILTHANTLQTATDTSGLSHTASEVNHRLHEYHDYFE